MKKSSLILLSSIFMIGNTESVQAQKRQWEVGIGAEMYKCEMSDIVDRGYFVTNNDGTYRIGSMSLFNRSEATTPVAYSLYVRTPISRKDDRLWIQTGFGLWSHTGLVYLDNELIPDSGPSQVFQEAVSINAQYWQVPLSLQYRQKLFRNLSVLLNAGVTINWRKSAYDTYTIPYNPNGIIIYDGLMHYDTYSSRAFVSPKFSLAVQYSLKRHSISAAPFLQLGNSMVNNTKYASYDNFGNAKWRTPYGIGVQYYYRIF